MQQQFIDNFNELRHQNESRGLLISATGTGKRMRQHLQCEKCDLNDCYF